MTIAYQLAYEYGDYTHADIIETSTDYDALLKQFHEFLGECLMDSVIDNNSVDYVCIEAIENGEDIGEVCIEYIFNQPTD